jgi:hypothetical protein
MAINVAIACTTLLLNIIFPIVVIMECGLTDREGGVPYKGPCFKTNSLSLISHLIINILDSILLNASNYAMQVLASPTREQVDTAHKRHCFLRISF